MCLSKREREFIEDWLSCVDGKMTLLQFTEKWRSESSDWKVYMRVLRHRISKKYDVMLKDLLLMKRFLDLDRHP